jgi:signal transduction histidine kinase
MSPDGHKWRGRAAGNALLGPAYDAMGHGVLLVIPLRGKNRIRVANRALAQLLDIDAEALVGKPDEEFWDGFAARVSNPHAFRDDLARILANPLETRTDILHLQSPRPLTVERSTSPLFDSQGTYLGRLWTFRNASREFRLKDELQKRRKTEFCFRSLSSYLFEAGLSADSLTEICRIACTGMDVASVVYAPLGTSEFNLAQFGVSRRYEVGPRAGAYRAFLSKVLRKVDLSSTTVLNTEDVAVPGRELFADRQIVRLLIVPIGYGDAIFGGVVLEEAEEERLWTREDFRCVESLARAMGLWIHKEQGEQKLLRAREAVEAASRARTDFIALLSHELRTPLNPLLGFTQLLEEQREMMPEEARDMVSRIADGAMRLRELVEDLLTLTRLDSRLDGWRRYHCDPRGIVEDSCTWARRLAREKGVEVELEMDADLGAVEADGAALRRALNAMLSNAVRFSPENGRVTVRAIATGDLLRVEISDQGPGVADDVKARIFEPFVQGEPVLTRRHGGAGIGLTLVRKVADSHEGRAWVEDGAEGGSVFLLELPRSVIDPE